MTNLSSLHHQKTLFIDDTPYVLDSFKHGLQELTGNSAFFLLHTTQTEEELQQEILAYKPQILLLDGNLSHGIKGYHILPDILKRDSDIVCIGFSSAESLRSTFMQAGAKGFVYKDPDTADACLQELERTLHTLTREA